MADQPVDRTYQALCEGSLAIVPPPQLNQWVTDHPEVAQAFSRQLAQQLAQVSAQLNQEQERQTALLPYRVPRVERALSDPHGMRCDCGIKLSKPPRAGIPYWCLENQGWKKIISVP
ncbi:MAG: hypothetical protein HC818_03010 [Synechococcaceae cyanobacterium RM1_1_27]|nr:hypothetical protein [Synechococcaceae cyanobacterium RM1_1_27]